MADLTHFDDSGNAHMVDISDKQNSFRTAKAACSVQMSLETLKIISDGSAKKGDVLNVARIAGIQGAKKTSDLIPLCHNINLASVSVVFKINTSKKYVYCEANVSTSGKTGVEMEALTTVQIGLLTIYDMCKSIDKGMRITDIQLELKKGGASGEWRRTK